MAFNDPVNRYYEAGVSDAVLFIDESPVAWNGMVSVALRNTGGEPEYTYVDGERFFALTSRQELEGTIEAYYSPVEFDLCDGYASVVPGVSKGQQARLPFHFAYKSLIGNGVDGLDHGYKIHLIYNARVKPAELSHNTLNDSPEAGTVSWDFTTSKVNLQDETSTSIVVLNSLEIGSALLSWAELILFGTDSEPGRMIMPDEFLEADVAIYDTAIYDTTRYL